MMTFKKWSQFIITELIDKNGVLRQQKENELIYDTRLHTITFRRLPELEQKLKGINSIYQCLVYHSNQSRNHSSEIEVYIEKDGKEILLSFVLSYLDQQIVNQYTYGISKEGNPFMDGLPQSYQETFPEVEKISDETYKHIQSMNEYRLHFATNEVELKKEN